MQVGAVPGYTTGHVEQPGAMNNTYNNYGATQTSTVYGPANMSNMPMKMANQSNYLSKTGAQGFGATSLVSTNLALHPLVPHSTPFLSFRQALPALKSGFLLMVCSNCTAGCHAVTWLVCGNVHTGNPVTAGRAECCTQS